jgi:Protein of unknown function (DUF4231)
MTAALPQDRTTSVPDDSTAPARAVKPGPATDPTGKWGKRRPQLDEVKTEIEDVLSLADIAPDARVYLTARWAAQVERAARNVGNNKRNYYLARIPAVVGALVLPALTTPSVDAAWIRWAAWLTSLIVAVATGVESVFRFGSRWRLYRMLLDSLRAEAWAFQFSLAPAYSNTAPDRGVRTFLTRCEDILSRHGDSYVADVVTPGERDSAAANHPADAEPTSSAKQ